MADETPPTIAPEKTGWENHYRLVASQFPPIALFEDYVEPALVAAAYHIEGLTNPRLRAQAGDLNLVKREDYLLGHGSTPVMAAFTHTGRSSRFTNGSFGVYYAGNTLDTAIAEVKFHRARFLEYTKEPPGALVNRCYIGQIKKPLLDVRNQIQYEHYLLPDVNTYPASQKFSARLRAMDAWGLLYPSVRSRGGECVAFYRPPAVGIPKQHRHLIFQWNGETITEVYEARLRS